MSVPQMCKNDGGKKKDWIFAADWETYNSCDLTHYFSVWLHDWGPNSLQNLHFGVDIVSNKLCEAKKKDAAINYLPFPFVMTFLIKWGVDR